MISIPFDPSKSADQSLRIQLGDQLAELRLRWNVRSESWSLDMSGDFGVLYGLKLVPNWPLLWGREAISIFQGDFLVLPLTNVGVDGRPGYTDLGVTWGLFWIDPDERLSWRSYNGLG